MMSYSKVSIKDIVGQKFACYQVEHLLSYSDATAMYAAQHLDTNQRVIVVLFLVRTSLDQYEIERFMLRFERETSSLSKLRHAHVLPMCDAGMYEGYPFVVFPALATGSLATLLKQRQPLPPVEVWRYFEQIADGLDYLHSQGVVHGSLKPANLALDGSGNILLSSTGLIHLLAARDVNSSNPQPYPYLRNFAGSYMEDIKYLAPEVVRGAHIDTRADVYALGITLFELLCGQTPFGDLTPSAYVKYRQFPPLQQFNPALPAHLNMVLQSALAYEPTQRVASAHELLRLFVSAMDNPFLEAPREQNTSESGGSSWLLPSVPRTSTASPTLVARASHEQNSNARKRSASSVFDTQRRKIFKLIATAGLVTILGIGGFALTNPAAFASACGIGHRSGAGAGTGTGTTPGGGTGTTPGGGTGTTPGSGTGTTPGGGTTTDPGTGTPTGN